MRRLGIVFVLGVAAFGADVARADTVKFFRESNEPRIMNCGVEITTVSEAGVGALVSVQVAAVDKQKPVTIFEATAIRFAVQDGKKVTIPLSIVSAKLTAKGQALDIPQSVARGATGGFTYVEKYSSRSADLLRALASPPVGLELTFSADTTNASYRIADAMSGSDKTALDRCLKTFSAAF